MKHLVVVAAIALAAATAYAAGGEAGGANPSSGLNRGLDMDRPGDTSSGAANLPSDRTMQLPRDRSLHPNRAGDAPDIPDIDETDPTTPGNALRHKPTNDLPPDINDKGFDNPAGPGTMR